MNTKGVSFRQQLWRAAMLSAVVMLPIFEANSITVAPVYDTAGSIVFHGFANFNLSASDAQMWQNNGAFTLNGSVKDTSNRNWIFDLAFGTPANPLTNNVVHLNNPAGGLLGTIAPQFDFYIGGRTVSAGTALNVFTHGGLGSLTQSGANVFLKDWWKITDSDLNGSYFADPGFTLKPGQLPPTGEIPEPMTMSLLAMGLLGGATARKRAKSAA